MSVILLMLPGCEKNQTNVTGEVELYLLQSYSTIDQTCAIDASSVELKDKPLISYSDFKSYDAKEYIFKISDRASKAVESLEHDVSGLPFAVVADNQLIYSGYFWPSYSSAMCQWIVIDPFMISGKNELRLRLGYPGPVEGVEIPDERNHELILGIFRRDGKLIE